MALDELKVYRTLALGLILLLLGGGLVYSIMLYRTSQKRLDALKSELNQFQSPEKAATDEQVISRVRRYMVLPEARPKVVTVSDVATLAADQPFFANARDGDKLLVYPEKVILYSPQWDQIVEVAQIRGAEASPAAIP